MFECSFSVASLLRQIAPDDQVGASDTGAAMQINTTIGRQSGANIRQQFLYGCIAVRHTMILDGATKVLHMEWQEVTIRREFSFFGEVDEIIDANLLQPRKPRARIAEVGG